MNGRWWPRDCPGAFQRGPGNLDRRPGTPDCRAGHVPLVVQRVRPSRETPLHGVKLRGGDRVSPPGLVSKHGPTGTSPVGGPSSLGGGSDGDLSCQIAEVNAYGARPRGEFAAASSGRGTYFGNRKVHWNLSCQSGPSSESGLTAFQKACKYTLFFCLPIANILPTPPPKGTVH